MRSMEVSPSTGLKQITAPALPRGRARGLRWMAALSVTTAGGGYILTADNDDATFEHDCFWQRERRCRPPVTTGACHAK